MMVVRFPSRRSAAVFVLREELGAWLVIARENGWAFGSYRAAIAEARRLAAPFGLPVRVEATPM